jgi:hypothetical protein
MNDLSCKKIIRREKRGRRTLEGGERDMRENGP